MDFSFYYLYTWYNTLQLYNFIFVPYCNSFDSIYFCHIYEFSINIVTAGLLLMV